MRGYFRGEPIGPGLQQMREGAAQGECIFCGDPAKPLSTDPDSVRRRVDLKRTHQDTCGDEACKRAHMRYWRRDQRRIAHNERRQAASAISTLEAALSEGSP